MEFDSLGLVFIGLSLMFLIAVLFGHQRREHMSNQVSKWDSIRRSVEDQLKEKYDFDFAEFRKAVSDQNTFFKESKRELSEPVLGFISINIPDVKDMKNTDKPFDERYRIIHDEMQELKTSGKKRDIKEYNSRPNDLLADEYERSAKSQLVNMARLYMINKVKSTKPKSGLSTISKLIG